MDIKYIVVQIDTSSRGNSEIKRIEFNDVEEAIEHHKANRYENNLTSYWDIVVEYRDRQSS